LTTQPRASHSRAERRFALQALERFGLPGASLRLLKFSETAHYRVDAAAGRFALRLHPPGRMPEVVLRSELAWLVTLSREAALWVPEPVPAPDGETVVVCRSPGGADYRLASLFRWMPGGHKVRGLTGPDAYRMGRCLGELHAFAAGYTPPADFTRWELEWGEFADEVVQRHSWFVLASDDAQLLARAIAYVQQALAELREDPAARGLIHGDTNLSNFRFAGARVGLLDFEVCCFGYYLFDVTRTLLGLAEAGDRAPQLAMAFHRGYGSVRAVPPLDHPHMLAFQVMNIVDLIVWILRWDERMPREDSLWQLAAALVKLRELLRYE
jgi:Ser/Thr protein kinase RdoA (MazF antagonist)